MSSILIIDDDRALARALEIQLSAEGHDVRTAGDAAAAMGLLEDELPDLVLLDLGLPDRPGLEVLDEMLARHEGLKVVIITGRQEMQDAIRAMQAGAFDYLRKPFDFEEILILIQKAGKRSGGADKAASLSIPVPEQGRREIVGSDRKVLEVVKKIGLLSRSRVGVLIEGESGTGKELVARALHRASSPEEPFVAINCSALSGSLVESELFGHEKGAFTGAHGRKTGKLEHAGEGTLFLDEIGDMPAELQTKVLRVLQEREFERVGGLESIPFRARAIAATNRDLDEMVRRGSFREDLYYRLAVSRIEVPPLRERKGDIPALTAYLVGLIGDRLHRRVTGVNSEGLAALQSYDWPGNVRELENVLTRAVALTTGELITGDELEGFIGSAPGPGPKDEPGEPGPLWQAEKRHIEKALRAKGWNITRTAETLEISPTTLRKKIRDYSLKK